MHHFIDADPGGLTAIEGPKEVDQGPYLYNGSSTLSAEAQFQRALSKRSRAIPRWRRRQCTI